MFSKDYPNLDWWINNHGRIELGGDDNYFSSWVRILDMGGMCWEDENSSSLDEALKLAERWASVEIEDRFGEEPAKRYED